MPNMFRTSTNMNSEKTSGMNRLPPSPVAWCRVSAMNS